MFSYKEKNEFRALWLEVQGYSCPDGIAPDDFSPIVRLIIHSLFSYFEETKGKISLKETFDTLYALLNFSSLQEEKKVQVNAAMRVHPTLFALHQIDQGEASFYEDKKKETDFSVLQDKDGEYLSNYIDFSGTILFGHLAGVVDRLGKLEERIELESSLSQNPAYSFLFRQPLEEKRLEKKEEKKEEGKTAPFHSRLKS